MLIIPRVKKFITGASFLVLLFSSGPVLSSPDKAKIFGKGQPLQAEDLPPGRAKDRLEQLPPAARQQALKWMQRFSFPESDLEFLHFDNEGGVFYADTHEVELVEGATGGTTGGISGIQPEDTFRLHSRPGAAKVVFLDFDGHTISGTAWNSGMPDPLYARPFDIDGNPSGFGTEEVRRIQEIWHRVAEDFAPFDIDVTTEDPGVFGPTTGRILITHNIDANNNYMPHSNAGGVAYVGVYGASYYGSYSPALVYYNNLGNGYPTYVAEAASHEFGHNLGLSHDGRGSPYNEGYYTGHGSGYVSWGPIMGVGYYTNVTQWSMGEYAYANNFQDDVSLISARLGFRADDHSNFMSGATPLVVEVDGSIFSSNPETENYQFPSSANKGVIESRADVDFFFFETDAGVVNLAIEPAWAAFYRDNLRGANLDIKATLYNMSGQAIAVSDFSDNTDALISANVPAGGYYLEVSGVGNAVVPFSDYGSLGQYFISGTVAVTLSPPAAPSGLVASAFSSNQVSLSWNDASENEDGFRIERSVDQVSWMSVASLSANVQSFQDTGLNKSTTYFYRVVSFNADGEGVSGVASATTPNTAPSAPNSLVAYAMSHDHIYLTWNETSVDEDGFRVERSLDQSNWSVVATLAANSIVYHDYGLNESTTYFYRVVAFNSGGDAASNVASNTTGNAPPAAATGLTATAASAFQVDLSWVDNATNEDGYSLERSQDQSSWVLVASLPANTESFTDTAALQADTTYFYRVVARNTGHFVSSGVVSVTTPGLAPSAATDVVATAMSTSRIDLSWMDNADNETGFRVERSLDQSGWAVLATLPVNATTFSDTSLNDATAYFYRVVAFNNSGEAASAVAGSVTFTSAPSAPSELSAMALSASEINLQWVDDAVNEAGFRVERSIDQASWTVITTLPENGAGFSDTGLSDATTYFYRVVAFNEGGEAVSAVVSATTHSVQLPPAMPVNVMAMDGANGTALINWTDASDNETGFEVQFEKLHAKRGIWQGLAIIGTTAADIIQLIHSSGAGIFHYRVRAVNTNGVSGWSEWAEVVVTDATKGGKGGAASATLRRVAARLQP